MNSEQTETIFTSVNANEVLAPEFSEDVIVSPMVIEIHLPKGLNQNNFAQHQINCLITFDKDFSNLLHPRIVEEVLLALRSATIAETYDLSDGRISSAEFLGELVQETNQIMEERSHINVKFE